MSGQHNWKILLRKLERLKIKESRHNIDLDCESKGIVG